MVIETFRRGKKSEIYERFRLKGRMLPDGLEYIDSWIETGGNRCFQLMKTDDAKLFDAWTAQWNDLVDFEIVPVERSPTQTEE